MKRVLLGFYSRFDTYITSLVKFILSFGMMFIICWKMGFDCPVYQPLLMIIIAAFCSFLPANTMILTGTVYLEAELISSGAEAALVGGILLFLLILLYFCFIPRQAYVVILTALCISLKVPFIIPMVCALMLSPSSIVGMVFGVAISGFAGTLHSYPSGAFVFSEEMITRLFGLVKKLGVQRELFLYAIVLTAVFLVIYLIRRMPVRYSWYVAIVSGLVTYLLLGVMGQLLLQMPLEPVILVLDIALGLMAGLLLRYFCFRLDYRKIQFLQFEDDNYYYYVKAVAKLDTGSEPDRYEEENEGEEEI